MKTFTYSKARQNFSYVLEQAKRLGEIYIQRRDGSMFVLKPFLKSGSPLDVSGVDVKLTKEEISGYPREIRKRSRKIETSEVFKTSEV